MAVVVRSLGLLAAGALVGGLVVTEHAADAGDRATGAPPPRFGHPVANPYYPITSGLVTRLRGTDDGGRFHEVVRVTHRTKTIQGVRTTVVLDVLRRADGTLAEKTHDWYADDNDGNVWYFGERTATYDRHGHVQSREGSWQAGVHGAIAGTIMPADPQVTDAYRQEYLKGAAEDQAWLVQRGKTVRVPAGRFHHVLKSLEWSRLEPGVVSVKLYAPGVGIIAEHDLAGGTETFRLSSVSAPAGRS